MNVLGGAVVDSRDFVVTCESSPGHRHDRDEEDASRITICDTLVVTEPSTRP